MSKRVHLEVNDSGGWRRVMSFDAQHDDDADTVMHLADQLLRWGDNPRQRARIIIPCDTAPLMTWCRRDGWREWQHPAERAQGAPA